MDDFDDFLNSVASPPVNGSSDVPATATTPVSSVETTGLDFLDSPVQQSKVTSHDATHLHNVLPRQISVSFNIRFMIISSSNSAPSPPRSSINRLIN